MFGIKFGKRKSEPLIYIIEDSRTFLISLKSKLRLAYNDQVIIKGFSDSKSFFDENQGDPQIIIMDFYLGEESESDGTDLLQAIKSKYPQAFTIVLTGEEDVNIAKECFSLGADSYIVKTPDSLDKIVKEIQYKAGLKKLI